MTGLCIRVDFSVCVVASRDKNFRSVAAAAPLLLLLRRSRNHFSVCLSVLS